MLLLLLLLLLLVRLIFNINSIEIRRHTTAALGIIDMVSFCVCVCVCADDSTCHRVHCVLYISLAYNRPHDLINDTVAHLQRRENPVDWIFLNNIDLFDRSIASLRFDFSLFNSFFHSFSSSFFLTGKLNKRAITLANTIEGW